MRAVTFFVLLMTNLGASAFAQNTVKGIECGGNNDTLGAYLSIKLVPGINLKYNLILSRRTNDSKVNLTDEKVATDLPCTFGPSKNIVTAECLGGSRMGPEYFSVAQVIRNDVRGQTVSYEIGAQSKKIADLKDKGLDVDSVFSNGNSAKEAINLILSNEYSCQWL